MTTLLVTAFEPYGEWAQNASWLALVELTRNLPDAPQVVTRRYPVDFAVVKRRLAEDLAANYDFALHLGQAPGSAQIRLEAIGLNLGGVPASRLASASGSTTPGETMSGDLMTLCDDGPLAYRSQLPLADWAARLRQEGIPTQVSYHAGTYLCNALLYWSHYFAERQQLKTRSTFIHLPLDPSQVADAQGEMAALPASISAEAVRRLLPILEG